MVKVLAKIVLTALAVGLVAETAVTLYTGHCPIDTASELVILWGVTLGVAIVTAWKAINGTLVKHHYHTVYVEREPEEKPEEETDTETKEEEQEEE
jgi:ammonia channel protein AmtB